MAASKTRNAKTVRPRSGGQESEALMSYLAMVKDQCKPPVYSAFISLINAYHGNMLAVDALIGELFALFSPRVFLLYGIKPLVDKSYHPRIDELCDKVSSSSSSGGGDGGGVSGDTYLPTSLKCSSDKSNKSATFPGTMDVHAATSKPELGGGGGNHARASGSESGSTRSLSPVDSGGEDKGPSIRGGIGAGDSPGPKRNPASVTSISSSSRRKAGGSCSTGGGRRDNDQELGAKPTLGSPNTGALHSNKADIGELLSDIDPTVDPALLDFMMRDNSPAFDSSAAQMDPPSLTLHQEQQQQQHHWSPSSTTLDQALLGGTDQALLASMEHALPSVRLSPTKKRGGTEESSVGPSSTEKHVPRAWHRSGSSSSLTELACRVHDTPNAGCQACRGGGGARALAIAKSPGPSQNRQRCNVAISASSSSRTSPTVIRRASLSGGRQGPVGGPGTSTPNGNENFNLEDEVFLGSGKRVWNEKDGGSGGGASRMAMLSSSSAPPDSFFFPSAAAGNGTAASRPHIKRRVSTDAAANGIEEEHSPVQRNGSSDAAFSSGSGGSGGINDNDRGSNGSNGGGLKAFGVLDSDPMNNEFAGVRSVRSIFLRQESPSSSMGEGILSKSGSDLEKLVMNVATKGMQQALQYSLRHTFSVILLKKDREIAELKEEALRWAENDTRLRQLNQQLLNDNMQLRAPAGWETHPSSSSP